MAKRPKPKRNHPGKAPLKRRAGRPIMPAGQEAQPEAFLVMNFEVTWDVMPDPAMDALPKATRDRMQKVIELVHRNPKRVIPELRDLVARHPGVPCFTNWLVSALRSGTKADRREALELCEKLFHEVPGYFFARTTLADLWLDDGKIEMASELLFGPDCVLTRLYPGRKVFHISEIRHWAYLCARAKIFLGEPEVAEGYRDMLEQLEPGSPAVRHLNEMLDGEGSMLTSLIASLKKSFKGTKAGK